MSEAQSRRQSRNKRPKSYRLADDYSFLDDEAESAASGTQTPDIPEADDDGDDFMPDAEEEPEDDFEEDVEEEVESDASASDEEQPSTPGFSISELGTHTPTSARPRNIISTPKDFSPKTPKGTPRRPIKGAALFAKPSGNKELRTRGVADFTKCGGQEVRLKDLYGQKNEDLKPILSTRDHWSLQYTFPLREPGSVRRSFFDKPGSREKESQLTRKWYAEIGRAVFAKLQKSAMLSIRDGQTYLRNAGPHELNVLAGKIDSPQLRPMKKHSYINVDDPFKDKTGRRGWLFNLGARVQDAQWAPKEHDNTQYLAVTVHQKAMNGRQTKPLENLRAPAFTATKSFPASIQIWAFESDSEGQLDSSVNPRLQVVLCTDWGAPKQIRWCPVETSDELDTSSDTSNIHVGILAGIWSDGRLRLIDISYPKAEVNSETHYVQITQAAFDISFPQTIPSCLHWLSGTTIAVATAAGTIAIWTLSRSDTLPLSASEPCSPKPWFYQQMADTYILTLSSGWPSQPQFISITTADGFARLYDIRTPNADTAASIRGRTLCMTQTWHEHTQSFIMPDEHYMLKHNPIRRFHHNLYSMRAESSITRVASSPVHPGVLIGGADGRIETTNPVGRITNYKIIPWQQTWFMHEWRGPVDKLEVEIPGQDIPMDEGGPVGEMADPSDSNANNAEAMSTKVSQLILQQPLVRITEGYKAFQPGISHSVTSKKPTNSEMGKGITIFEEQSAVTALAWNPNLKYGTWAVAGMGSGLLRVEDVGV